MDSRIGVARFRKKSGRRTLLQLPGASFCDSHRGDRQRPLIWPLCNEKTGRVSVATADLSEPCARPIGRGSRNLIRAVAQAWPRRQQTKQCTFHRETEPTALDRGYFCSPPLGKSAARAMNGRGCRSPTTLSGGLGG